MLRTDENTIYFVCDVCGDTTLFKPTIVEGSSKAEMNLQFPIESGWTYALEDNEVVNLCEDCSHGYEIAGAGMSVKDYINLYDDEDEYDYEEMINNANAAIKAVEEGIKEALEETLDYFRELNDLLELSKAFRGRDD